MGLPIAFAPTGGEVSDYKGYLPIMDADGPTPKVLLADKGYEADFIREDKERRGGVAMIPTKRNRLIQMPEGWQPDTTKPQTAISASFTSSQSDCGCANLSPPPRLRTC